LKKSFVVLIGVVETVLITSGISAATMLACAVIRLEGLTPAPVGSQLVEFMSAFAA
jgi:hypothetical protein